MEATTSAGNLNAQMTQVGKYLRLSASSGDINLELPLHQGLDLDVRGSSINQHPANISCFTGEWNKDHIRGSVNGGGVPVNADASGGDVHVKFN